MDFDQDYIEKWTKETQKARKKENPEEKKKSLYSLIYHIESKIGEYIEQCEDFIDICVDSKPEENIESIEEKYLVIKYDFKFYKSFVYTFDWDKFLNKSLFGMSNPWSFLMTCVWVCSYFFDRTTRYIDFTPEKELEFEDFLEDYAYINSSNPNVVYEIVPGTLSDEPKEIVECCQGGSYRLYHNVKDSNAFDICYTIQANLYYNGEPILIYRELSTVFQAIFLYIVIKKELNYIDEKLDAEKKVRLSKFEDEDSFDENNTVKKTATSSRRKNEPFYTLIQYPDKDKLLKRLHELIDGKGGKAVAEVLFCAYDIKKYLSDRPTEYQVRQEFSKIKGTWKAIEKYLNSSYLAQLRENNNVVIFFDE
ncbi:MAG: hypothetical protein LUC88_05725 [Prevotella sp.]|nr:hypothetical protein [Prevotella sp.]